jgi:EAL domain-containing protein (putative c-di-GMP-specific phosphodiesterase class I)
MGERDSCGACRNGEAFAGAITMAFQPIVDAVGQTVFAHEALVRGADGASAADVLASVDANNQYAFDQKCRVRALECAVEAQLPAMVSINFLPNAVYNPEHCMRTTLAAAQRLNLLADFQPDLLKLDIGLIRSIDTDKVRQRIVRHVSQLCDDLDVRVIGEGVETADESSALVDLGIVLQQGFLFARPATGKATVPGFPAR